LTPFQRLQRDLARSNARFIETLRHSFESHRFASLQQNNQEEGVRVRIAVILHRLELRNVDLQRFTPAVHLVDLRAWRLPPAEVPQSADTSKHRRMHARRPQPDRERPSSNIGGRRLPLVRTLR
jgi:hypothetical protein